ncbi:MAG: type II secretion system GspH family protein, partial [Pseudomonadales bacterium]|nr:type II secretion system GspH family protein [Pseudomonadales bacterium]
MTQRIFGMKHTTQQKGFTLIEMLIVIA